MRRVLCIYLLIQPASISGGFHFCLFVLFPFSLDSATWLSLPVALSGARDGSVQSDASSSPSEQSQLGQTHPAYPMGPQVSEKIHKNLNTGLMKTFIILKVKDIYTVQAGILS